MRIRQIALVGITGKPGDEERGRKEHTFVDKGEDGEITVTTKLGGEPVDVSPRRAARLFKDFPGCFEEAKGTEKAAAAK